VSGPSRDVGDLHEVRAKASEGIYRRETPHQRRAWRLSCARIEIGEEERPRGVVVPVWCAFSAHESRVATTSERQELSSSKVLEARSRLSAQESRHARRWRDAPRLQSIP